MELKNIFKMEMFKNRNDKPYLLVIVILTIMAATATFLGVLMAEYSLKSLESIEIILVIFLGIGLTVLSLLYPFHLLNVDYKNKVISLIFASGVSRWKYYLVKISATILSTLIAAFVILAIPMAIFLIVYPDEFVKAVQEIITDFNASDTFAFLLSSIMGLIAIVVMLTTAVIITRGKTSGIFLFFAFLFATSTIQTFFSFSSGLLSSFMIGNVSENLYLDAVYSIVKIIVFALIGLQVLKKQDL